MDDLIERVARAWASIDGKANRFDVCKADPAVEDIEGHYQGYCAEARELLRRSGIADALAAITAERDGAIARNRELVMALAGTEALEMQHGAVIERLTAERDALRAELENQWVTTRQP